MSISQHPTLRVIILYLILLNFLCNSQKSFSQTQLAQGDLLFTAIQWSNGDGFELITFRDLCPNTVFYASDNAYQNASGFCNPGTEFTIRITVTSLITAGSKIRFDDTGAPGTIITSSGSATVDFPFVAVGGNNTGFNNNTDNCFIFQGTYSNPIFICGVKTNANWTNSGAVSCSNVSHSELPSQLTNGIHALVINGTSDAARYNCSVSSGSISTMKSAIINSSNWVDATVHNTTCSFTLTNTVSEICTYSCSGNIWFEDFNSTSYPARSTTGLNINSVNTSSDWTTSALDCDDATPLATLSQSYWGTYNGEFLCNDIEGGPCTCSGGGTTWNEFTTEVIDISNYCNVIISMDFRNTGTMEFNTSASQCNNADDIIQGMYSLNGGAWTQWFFDDGPVNFSPAYINNLNGSTIQLKVQVGNKANDERHFFDNICVSGTLKPATPTGLSCYQTATWNPTICAWVVSGTQPAAPTGLACYETATFNTATCAWVVSGTQPAAPNGLACYETATFNSSTCSWNVSGTQPAAPTGLACYETATFNTATCSWVVSGTQPAVPTGLACYETANFNTATCSWVVSGTQPAAPTGLACYETATFNSSTCSWVVSGTQPAAPTGLACYETASFNTATCAWVVSGTQPAVPTGLACFETATFNTATCSWVVSGTQPAAPTGLACYETATFNTTTCAWVISGTQPAAPTGLACYETATFNSLSCSWVVSGTQPAAPTGLACYETATFNSATCSWNVSGTQPAAPTGLACYETATFNTATCAWVVSGTQPAAPTGLACYETATFNTATCSWVVSGTQPAAPTGLACYETATFNTTTCSWVVSGTQPAAPTGLACYETATFNSSTCSWVVSGTQPAAPTGLGCYETATFNSSTCSWVVSGTQPAAPTGLACYETATFNTTTCSWVVSGTQPAAPTGIACYETATFNTTTCSWVVSGTQPAAPTGLACYETPTWNPTICDYVITGIQPTISVNSETICEGSSATLTATVNPIGGTILWGNSQNTASISVSPMVTTSYGVLYNINGCYLTASGTVTVNPIPTVSVSSATICNGETAIINATPSVSGGTFYWTLGGETTQSISVNPNSTTTYSAIYTLNGCTSQNASGTLTVHPIPAVSVNDISICEGENATLIATPSSIGGTFLWLPGGEINNSITISPNNSTSYSVLYTLNGCESTPATGTVTVHPIPSVSFSADQLTGCAPLTVNLINNSGNSSLCSWNLGNGQIINGCEIEYTFTEGGCYDISLTTTENGCSNSLTLNDYICVENSPIAAFTTSPSTILEGVNFQTISTSNFSTGATSYTWELSNGQFSSETSPDFALTYQNEGLGIMLIAAGEYGCIDSQFVFIPINIENEVFIPNTFTPDNNEVNQEFVPIFSSPESVVDYELLIFNRWGELIFESRDIRIGWNGKIIHTNEIVQDGIYSYVIHFRNKSDVIERKIGHVNLIR